jgi:predicted HD phosphohydrolase
MDTVSFVNMADGSREEYEFLDREWKAHMDGQATRNALEMLGKLKGPTLGYKIDRYQQSLQSATRALRAEESEEMVVAALLHDVGDLLAPENHSALAAAILEPYVSERTHWIVKHHGIFQGYYYFHHLGGDRDTRERYRGHPHFEACAAFCERYDQNCFDPDYDTAPLGTFVGMVERVFARPPYAAKGQAI